MIAISSTHVATWGNSSLTSAPHWPYFLKAKGEPSTLSLMLNTVVGGLKGSGFPCSCVRRGFGSKVSTCDGPPSIKRKMTAFALAGKCGAAARDSLASMEARASPPKPFAARQSIWRREGLRLPYINKLRGIQQHMADIGPRFGRFVARSEKLPHFVALPLFRRAREGSAVQIRD